MILDSLLVGEKGDNFSLTSRVIEHCESVYIVPRKIDEQSSGFCWTLSVTLADEVVIIPKSKPLSLRLLTL